MELKIKRLIMALIFFASIVLISFYSYSASGNGFKSFDNAPRYSLELKNNNLVITVKDYSGIEQNNIHVYLNDKKGKELTENNGFKSVKCLEKRPIKDGEKNVIYEYVIPKSFLKEYITKKNKYQKFYIEIKDRAGNYNNAYFIVNGIKDLKEYKLDLSPRIGKFATDGNKATFISRDLAGTSKLNIYDMNNSGKQVGKTKENLGKGNATVTIYLKNLVKDDNGKYKIKIYAEDVKKNNEKLLHATRTISFIVDDSMDTKNLSDVEEQVVEKTTVERTKLKDQVTDSKADEDMKIIKPTKITINGKEESVLKVNCGDITRLKVEVLPKNANIDNKVTFISKEPEIVKVYTSGKIRAISVGTTEIIAKTENGKIAKCIVTVKPGKYKEVLTPDSWIKSGMTATGSTQKIKTADGTKKFYIFNQQAEDTGWIHESGCCLCATTSLIKAYGGDKCEDVDPDYIYSKYGGFNWYNQSIGVIKDCGITRIKQKTFYSPDDLMEALKKGQPMSASVVGNGSLFYHTSGHNILLLGVTTSGKVIVGDSYQPFGNRVYLLDIKDLWPVLSSDDNSNTSVAEVLMVEAK